MSRRAFPGVDAAIQADFVRQQFVTGFPDVDLCKHLALKNADDLEELIASADLYYSIEAAHGVLQPRTPKPVVAVAKPSSSSDVPPQSKSAGPPESFWGDVMNKLKEILVLLTPERRPAIRGRRRERRNQSAMTCFNCGVTGHGVSSCPELKCLSCGASGHLMTHCNAASPSTSQGTGSLTAFPSKVFSKN